MPHKPLSIEYIMYAYGLSLLFAFMTWLLKKLRLATIFYPQSPNGFFFQALFWRFFRSHKSDSINRRFFHDFFSHIGQLVQIVLIFLCCYGQQETKLYFLFIDPSLLFSGFCIHKYEHKLQSSQGIRKIIFYFNTFYHIVGRSVNNSCCCIWNYHDRCTKIYNCYLFRFCSEESAKYFL